LEDHFPSTHSNIVQVSLVYSVHVKRPRTFSKSKSNNNFHPFSTFNDQTTIAGAVSSFM